MLPAALLMGASVMLSGCHIDMWAQPKMKAYYESDFFADRSEMRPLVPHTVSQSNLETRLDDAYSLGRAANGKFLPRIPAKAVRSFASPKDMMLRGQERFTAYCSPCHGSNGDGNGMITQRGLGYWQKLPASYYTDRLRKIEDGYIYDVLVNGHGVMYGYGSRIQDINDRWAVVSYVRALQFAHNASPSLAPAGAFQAVEGDAPAKSPGGSPELGEGLDINAAVKPTVRTGSQGTERPVNRSNGGGTGSENADQNARGAESSAGGTASPSGRGGAAKSGQAVSPNPVPTTAAEGATR
jgi:mono/diheme cytochrome c family protein